MGLNPKQQAFVDHYLQCWSARTAAERAGYSAKSGTGILAKPAIKEAIKQRVEERRMTSDEALDRLAALARADISDLITVSPLTDQGWYLDIPKAIENGSIAFVGELKMKKDGLVDVKMVDKLRALFKMLQVLGLDSGEADEDERDWWDVEDE